MANPKKKEPEGITTFEYEDDPSILATGPVVIKRGCRPMRYVLRELGKTSNGRGEMVTEYVTHAETLELVGNVFRHEAYYHGNYFFDLKEANEDWLERVKRG